MKFATRKDQLGNVIGYDRVSDDGTILESSNTNEAVAQPTPLPGERVALPTMSGDFRSSAERRADEAAASKASGSDDEDESGYNIPKSVLNDIQGSSGAQQESQEPKEEFKRTPEGQAMYEENLATDARLAAEREEGGFTGAFAGFQQLGRNVARGVIDAAEDFSDFGAAVIDTARKVSGLNPDQEINNDDNWFNPSARVTDPTSAGGKIVKEITSFGVSAVTVGGILGKVPAVANLASGGWKARAAYSAGTGAVTDFIKAKEGEETLSNAVQGTPLANPVTRFLAADTDEDANLWLNKTKATIEGSVLGLGMDLFGEGLTVAFRKAKIEPMERLMVGLRNAKKLPDDQQVDAMKALDVEVAETVEKTQQLLLKASEDIQDSVITDARRLLKAAPEPTRGTVAAKVSTIDVDNLPKVGDPTITAGGTKGPEAYIERLELLEEEITKVSDLKLGIFEMGIGADTQQLDDILFELSDELEAVESAVRGISSPLPGAFDISPERADLISKLEGPRITPKEALGDARAPKTVSEELEEISEKLKTAEGEELTQLELQKSELEELEIDSLPPEEYLAKYQPDELRTPQEPPKVTVKEGAIGEAARFDGPGATPDRTANIIGGKPGVVEGRVGQPQGRYRTKPEIRRDIAEKAVAKRMAPEGPVETPKSTKGKSSNPKSVEAVEVVSASTRKAARAIGISPDELKNNLLGRSKGEPVGRFMNMGKQTDSEAVSEAFEVVLKTLEDSQITAKLTDGQLQRRASNLVNGLKFIDDKTADKVLEAYVGITSNVPAAQQAIRMMAEDMGEQLVEAANRVSLGKKVNDLTIDDLASDTDLAYKLSRFQYFIGFNKNLGAVQAQGFRARGLKVTPDEVANRLAKANYEKSKGLAKAATEDPQQMTDAILKALRTPEGRKKFSAVKADLVNAKSLEDIANAAKWAKLAFYGNKAKNMLLGIRMNNILSGSTTNLTNVVSNGTMALYVPATQAAGAMIDMPYRILRGDKAGYKADKKAMAEALGMYSGLIQYLGDSSQMARKAFKAGKGIIGEDQLAKEVADISQLQPLDGPLNISTALSHTLTMPSRLLVTGDEFFKQLNYRAFVSSQATQDGIEKGLKGKKLKEYAEGMLNKSFKIDENTGIQGLGLDPKGKEYAEFVTFQSTISKETSKYREGAVGVVRKLNETPVLEHLTPLFVPFIKTPANIMAYTGRNSPLALLSKSWHADFAAGGAKRAQAIGEFAMGSAALGGIMRLAFAGKLTGRAPVDKGEREQWYAQGYQPYSIRVGNSWVSFQRMEPFAGHFSIVADMVNATSRSAKEDKLNLEDTQAHILGSFVAAVRNRTFFEGLSDLTDLIGAIGSTDSRDANTITNVRDQIAATLVPYSSALNEQRRARDLTLREAEGLVEIVMNKIPGMSENLPAQRNWLTGKPIEYQSNPILNLYPSSAMKNDPLIKNLLKYNVPLNPPDKKIKGGVEISNKQYSDLLALTGQIEINGMTQYQALSKVFEEFDTTVIDAELDYIQAHDEYARSTPLSVEVAGVRSAYAKAAESALVQANPELLEQVRTNLTEKGSVKEGMFWMNSPLFEETGYAPGDDPDIDEAASDINTKVNKSLKGLVEGAGPTSVDGELIQ